ncbi:MULTISPECIES: DUF1129 family protein [Bacillaceae]|uniref:DUF1129 family protein n=1 Tax=Evansella alkalicola TaxID=745819 RepID=A0ABS6JYN5_9BACI|nr:MULTISPECIES: DUF1129 family protein [Bacillaceae]MBU9723710.1 DUF1129 family protein [Bacillus alkalicola]
MNEKELVQLNNKKREQLTKENRKYYEEMLVYIRLTYSKAYLETEEILSELIDHLLEAQQEGKTAEDVFGNNPKQYADDIIGELPNMVTKERLKMFFMAIFYFFAVSTIFSGIIEIFMSGSLVKGYYIGSEAIRTLVSIPVALLIVYVSLQYLRWACFKNINKIKEFFILWLWGTLSVGIFVVIFLLLPDVGPFMDIHIFVVFGIGIILFLAGHFMRKSM